MNNALVQSKIEQFVKCIQSGIEEWIKAGEIVCEILDDDPESIEIICQRIPGMSRDIIYRFEQIGRKKIHPNLLLSGCMGYKKLAKMPYSQQEAYSKAPIPVLVCKNNDEYDTMLIKAENLTPDQCKQVFSDSMVRDIAMQRAWLESEKRNMVINGIATEHLPYVVKGNKVVFRKDVELCKKELNSIIKLLK